METISWTLMNIGKKPFVRWREQEQWRGEGCISGTLSFIVTFDGQLDQYVGSFLQPIFITAPLEFFGVMVLSDQI